MSNTVWLYEIYDYERTEPNEPVRRRRIVATKDRDWAWFVFNGLNRGVVILVNGIGNLKMFRTPLDTLLAAEEDITQELANDGTV